MKAASSVAVLSLVAIAVAAMLAVQWGRSSEASQRPPPGRDLFPSSISLAQQAALADGLITPEEYAAAVAANAACLRSNGLRVNDGGPIQVGTEDDLSRADPLIEACNAEHLNGVALKWALQNMPSDTRLELARASLAACLGEAGVKLGLKADGRPDFAAAAQFDPSRFAPCSARVSADYGLPNFGG